jgi:hypothetical protein
MDPETMPDIISTPGGKSASACRVTASPARVPGVRKDRRGELIEVITECGRIRREGGCSTIEVHNT